MHSRSPTLPPPQLVGGSLPDLPSPPALYLSPAALLRELQLLRRQVADADSQLAALREENRRLLQTSQHEAWLRAL